MDPGILDHSFEQLAAERTFSLFLLYSNLGWSITISEHINAQDCRIDMSYLQSFQEQFQPPGLTPGAFGYGLKPDRVGTQQWTFSQGLQECRVQHDLAESQTGQTHQRWKSESLM